MLPAASPDAYVQALTGWHRTVVEALRASTLAAGALAEQIKWGHLVYSSNGPVLLIRAESERVLFGFWRGQRLRELDDRLRPGGKYEMAAIAFAERPCRGGPFVRRVARNDLREVLSGHRRCCAGAYS